MPGYLSNIVVVESRFGAFAGMTVTSGNDNYVMESYKMEEQGMEETNEQEAGVDLSPEVLKRAFKAFKKRLKLTALDEDSRLGHGAFSNGPAGVSAIQPPNQYPAEVWQELHRQGKVRNVGHGLYELPKPKPKNKRR